jgi:hypothetical protein
MAIHQLAAEPTLEYDEREHRHCAEEIKPADTIGGGGAAPDPPAPDSKQRQSGEQ